MSAAELPEQEMRPADVAHAHTVGELLGVVPALTALALVDVVMMAAGFARFHRLVRGFPTVGERRGAPEAVSAICSTVDRAAVYYFKRAWCLQRSATTACLLRLYGVGAQLVIGVEKQPFYAHAWVEVDGRVVNDHPSVQRRYMVIERC
jgi:hypothetical protein